MKKLSLEKFSTSKISKDEMSSTKGGILPWLLYKLLTAGPPTDGADINGYDSWT